jgi:5-formyltetrahydrofolate cyclo-ligase
MVRDFMIGFYPHCLKKTIKIGLSNFTPVERIEDINKYDVKMDFCVTTEQVWHFSQLSTST